jgi:hypothetical protein
MSRRTATSDAGRVRYLLSSVAFLVTAAAADGGEIRWKSGVEVTQPAAARVDLAAAIETLAARPNATRVVVQFSRPVTAAERAQLDAAGMSLLNYIDNHAYFAALRAADLDAEALAGIGAMQTVAPVAVEWKVHPTFLDGEIHDWYHVGDAEDGQPVVGAYVLLHPDVDLQAEGIPVVSSYEATVMDLIPAINGLVIELPFDAIVNLAADDVVQWIEPPLPRLDVNNNSNRARVQADLVQAAPYNLTGAGVIALVYDAGTARTTHVDFNGRLTAHDGSGQIDHATHVSGTVGGSGTANATYKGMAPGVQIRSYGFQYDGTGIFLYTNPGDMNSDYQAAYNAGATVSNNSIGTNTESNGFACSIQGDYGVTDNLIDSMVRGSLGGPFRIVWADGNERGGSRCDVEGYGDYYSTAPPATAKNHITVGALNSNNDSMTSFSSWGPTDDGRMKPDISGPGCQSDQDGGVTSCSAASNTAYTTYCGTSMASPTVCGMTALMLQDYRVQFGGPDPRNSTLKILLAHTAVDLFNVGPDHQSGYGSVRVKDAIDYMRTGQFIEETDMSQGATKTYTVNVPPGTPKLKITLAWDDVPGTPNVNPALVNDLDLLVFDPSSTRAYPWTLNPTNPSASAVRTAENHRDNIEQVVVDNPAAGNWTVEVFGFNVPQGPQPFSVCGTPNLSEQGVTISFPSGVPTVLNPGVSTTFDVSIVASQESVVPGSETLHYRYDGGTYLTAALTPLGGDLYEATLPPPVCAATPELYITAEGTVSGEVANPTNAPASAYAAVVGVAAVPFADSFETDQGWVSGAPGDTATTGMWNRMDPQGTAAQPEDDHSNPGTICWVTDGNAGGSLGSFDVDTGATTLTSPTIDLSGGTDPKISYWRWYSNNTGGAPNADIFVVDISNDGGGSWVNAETVGPGAPDNGGGWRYYEFDVTDKVALSSQIKLRFIASDYNTASLVEAALDDFRVDDFGCDAVLADCNGNGILDSDDIASGRSSDTNGNGVPDECDPPGGCEGDPACDSDTNGDCIIDNDDLQAMLNAWASMTGDPNYDPSVDYNGDGQVENADLQELLNDWANDCN